MLLNDISTLSINSWQKTDPNWKILNLLIFLNQSEKRNISVQSLIYLFLELDLFLLLVGEIHDQFYFSRLHFVYFNWFTYFCMFSYAICKLLLKWIFNLITWVIFFQSYSPVADHIIVSDDFCCSTACFHQSSFHTRPTFLLLLYFPNIQI